MTKTIVPWWSIRHNCPTLKANHNGSKRPIVESMASVGINADATDVVYAPAPGDTRSGFVTIRLVAQVTESAQLNSKKLWASHPLGRTCADVEGIMGPRKWKLLSQCDPKFEICRFSSLSIPVLCPGCRQSQTAVKYANMQGASRRRAE